MHKRNEAADENGRAFGELRDDEKFVSYVRHFDDCLDRIDETLTKVSTEGMDNYEELSTADKVKLDNYLAYSVNSLYWMYVRLLGIDPNEHGIKNELSRVRQAILRSKQIEERNTIRPVLDKAAAGRFIKHGLHIRHADDAANEPVTEME